MGDTHAPSTVSATSRDRVREEEADPVSETGVPRSCRHDPEGWIARRHGRAHALLPVQSSRRTRILGRPRSPESGLRDRDREGDVRGGIPRPSAPSHRGGGPSSKPSVDPRAGKGGTSVRRMFSRESSSRPKLARSGLVRPFGAHVGPSSPPRAGSGPTSATPSLHQGLGRAEARASLRSLRSLGCHDAGSITLAARTTGRVARGLTCGPDDRRPHVEVSDAHPFREPAESTPDAITSLRPVPVPRSLPLAFQ